MNPEIKVALNNCFSRYSEESKLELLLGLIYTDKEYSVPYFEKLLKHKEFFNFCRLFHEKLYSTVLSILRETDLSFLKDEVIKGIEEYELINKINSEIELKPNHYLKLISKFFVQYLSILAAFSDVTNIDEDKTIELIRAASRFPSTDKRKKLTGFPEKNKFIEILRKASPIIYKTKFETLNFLFGGGLRAKRLYVIGGSPGIGKSHLLLNFFVDACLNKIKTVYITIENSLEETHMRIGSYLTNISNNTLDSNLEELEKKLAEKETELSLLDKYGIIYEMTYCSIKDVIETIKESKPRVLIIDYLNIMIHNQYHDRAKDLEDLTLTLARLAKQYEIAIITACQQNREATKMIDPDKTTVGESFGIIKSSDVYMILYHPKYHDYLTGPEMILKIEKSRISKEDKIYLYANKACSRIREMNAAEVEELLSKMEEYRNKRRKKFS